MAALHRPLAVLLAGLVWAAASLATFLLARHDSLVIAAPTLGLALVIAWPWGRAYWKSLLILACGLAGGLCVLEGAIRLSHFGPDALTHPTRYGPYSALIESGALRADDDPQLLFGLRPGYQNWFMGYPLRVNSEGFRGNEVPLSRTPGVARILACGTSITMGAGVGEDDSYITVLGRALTKTAGRPVEAWNLGVGAYAASQVLRRAATAAVRYQPDVIIVELSAQALTSLAPSPASNPVLAPVPRHSTVERYSFAASALYPPASLRAKLTTLTSRLSSGATTPAADAAQRRAPETVATQLGELAALGRTHGFSVIVLLMRPMTNFSTPDLDKPARATIEALGRTLGIDVLDTYPLFSADERPDQFIVFPGDLHPNRAAHARMATALEQPVLARIPATGHANAR